MTKPLTILVAILPFLEIIYAQNDLPSWQMKLQDKLLDEYHRDVPPTHDGPVNVQLGLSIMDLEIDGLTSRVSIHAILQRVWNDKRLSWKPEDNNNTDSFIMNDRYVWKPDIELWNSGNSEETLDADVMVKSTGEVKQFQSLRIEFKCRLNYRYFPYDEQMCQMTFGSWHYHDDIVNLTSLYSENYAQHESPAPDFNLIDLKTDRHSVVYECCPDQRYVDLTYTLHLKRISSAYSVKLVLPAVLSGFMVLATFLLPPASHEKITFCGLLFVGILLQLIYIHDVVPASGETMLADLLVFALFIDVFASVGAVLSYHIATKSPQMQSDMASFVKTDGDDNDLRIQMPVVDRKTRLLRHIDFALFVLFTVVYAVGIAIILGHRG